MITSNSPENSPQQEVPPTLYQNIDEKELVAKSKKHLIEYGIKFEPDIITGSQGLYIYTASGRKVLDWTSGQMSCLLGHGHPEIVKVITEHASQLDHLFSGMISPPVVSLADRLCSALPA
ncbi:Aminotransferase class-III [Metarhizium album ARSEF 1941]|uniref:Aminotransferase class-III n=1 Tax=Metarhizium album (strain ARSEF 1941) TaxID=1081103 RepID=A0A0B2X817_METAS|nr:Aminotransferase class-III [Metarhizium album ARSEF 1941]KHO01650.1 Aminotransferase class-III [Metarhizium album ARSEF 1941]